MEIRKGPNRGTRGSRKPGPARDEHEPKQPVTVTKHQLSLVEGEPEGYNPYDKPGPCRTARQIETRFSRSKSGRH